MSIEHEIARRLKMEKYKEGMKGDGMYIFENNTKGDLYLPRATQSGRRLVRKGEQFLGDDYFFCMVRSNELKLVKELQASQEKLLTEQPPTVTNQGQVEYVNQTPAAKIDEVRSGPQDDVLLTESPVDGIKVLR